MIVMVLGGLLLACVLYLVVLRAHYLSLSKHAHDSFDRQIAAAHSRCDMLQSILDQYVAEHSQRESGLRSEVQSLTQAIARSGQSIPVVYPVDPARPLEPSPGWFDRTREIQSVKIG